MNLMTSSGMSSLLHISFITSLILSMPKSSDSVLLQSNLISLFLFIFSCVDLISDSSLFFKRCRFHSGIVKKVLWRIRFTFGVWLFSFSIISDPAFDFIEPVGWLTFRLVNSFVHLCILAVFVLFILSISAQFSLSHSFLACIHFFLIVVFSVRYSFSFLRIVCCSFFFPHSLFSCFVYFGMISFAESIVLLCMFHFDFVVSFRLHLFLILFLYNLKTNK